MISTRRVRGISPLKSRKTIIICITFLLLTGVFTIYQFQKPMNKVPEKNESKMVKKQDIIPVVEDSGGSHLQEIGEKAHQKNWGTLTLVNKVSINKTYTISPMEITLNEIKIIKLTDMTSQTKDLLREYTGLSMDEAYEIFAPKNLSYEELQDRVDLSKSEITNGITYFEISYSVKNTGSKELQFYSMKNVSINNKLTFKVPDKNFIFSEDTLIGTKDVSRVDYKPDESRVGNIGLLNDSGEKVQKITTFSFSTDDLLDGDTHELLSESQTFQINF